MLLFGNDISDHHRHPSHQAQDNEEIKSHGLSARQISQLKKAGLIQHIPGFLLLLNIFFPARPNYAAYNDL